MIQVCLYKSMKNMELEWIVGIILMYHRGHGPLNVIGAIENLVIISFMRLLIECR